MRGPKIYCCKKDIKKCRRIIFGTQLQLQLRYRFNAFTVIITVPNAMIDHNMY